MVRCMLKFWKTVCLLLAIFSGGVGSLCIYAYGGWSVQTQLTHIERRFNNIDARFDSVDARFTMLGGRIDALGSEMTRAIDRLEKTNERSSARIDAFINAHVQAYAQSHVNEAVRDRSAGTLYSGIQQVEIDAGGQIHPMNATA